MYMYILRQNQCSFFIHLKWAEVIFKIASIPMSGEINIEIDNDERGVIGDFTTISDIRITKAEL